MSDARVWWLWLGPRNHVWIGPLTWPELVAMSKLPLERPDPMELDHERGEDYEAVPSQKAAVGAR